MNSIKLLGAKFDNAYVDTSFAKIYQELFELHPQLLDIPRNLETVLNPIDRRPAWSSKDKVKSNTSIFNGQMVYYTTKVLYSNILWKIIHFLSVFLGKLMLWKFEEKQLSGGFDSFIFLFSKEEKNGSALHIRVGQRSTTKHFFLGLFAKKE